MRFLILGLLSFTALAADPELLPDLVNIADRDIAPVEVQLAPVEHRFAPPPPIGEHPRVLISPSELPALRERLETSAAGRRMYAAVRGWHRHAFNSDERLGRVWTALIAGDDDALGQAGDNWWLGNLELGLALAAADAMIADDAELGGQVGAALATLCRLRSIPDNRGNPKPHSGVVMNVALAYDFTFNFMTEAQQQTVRAWIARGTAGRESHGMGMPAERRTYNWMPHGMMLVIGALAIEGEEGYDPSIYPESVEVMGDFLTYGVYSEGVPREGTHYYNFGMGTGGAKAMVAFAKRGDNLFGHPHYYNSRHWYAHVIEPFGYAFATHHDTPNDQGGIYENYALMKWVWPDDPVIDFAWRNRVHDNYGGLNSRHGYLLTLLYALDWEGGENTERLPENIEQWGVDVAEPIPADVLHPWNPERMGLPNSLYSPTRGILYTRTAWGRDAMAFHFESKMDERGPSHAHANRNGWTLSALGRKWAIDQGYGIKECKQHNMVLIDGLGQGCFTPPGRVDALLDTPLATAICGDATYAYEWRYTFSSRRGNPENRGYEWEVEPLGPPTDGLHTLRARHNPVDRAWRSGALVRGAHPYVMLVDDIRKDGEPHLYEWLMQVPMDLQLERATSTELVLAAADAAEEDPRLLVRFVDIAPPASIPVASIPKAPRLEHYLIRRSANATGGPADQRLGKRLVVSTLAVEPRFKVLLFPYRPGTPLPQTDWQDGNLTVRWDDQVDTWEFGDAAAITMRRGEDFLTLKGPDRANVARVGDAVYVSGREWGRLKVPAAATVHHNGTVAAATPDGDGLILTEKGD